MYNTMNLQDFRYAAQQPPFGHVSGLVSALTCLEHSSRRKGDLNTSVISRTRLEVQDFLDARGQGDVALAEVNLRWIRDFTEYLTQFYDAGTVIKYLAPVRKVVANPQGTPMGHELQLETGREKVIQYFV